MPLLRLLLLLLMAMWSSNICKLPLAHFLLHIHCDVMSTPAAVDNSQPPPTSRLSVVVTFFCQPVKGSHPKNDKCPARSPGDFVSQKLTKFYIYYYVIWQHSILHTHNYNKLHTT